MTLEVMKIHPENMNICIKFNFKSHGTARDCRIHPLGTINLCSIKLVGAEISN